MCLTYSNLFTSFQLTEYMSENKKTKAGEDKNKICTPTTYRGIVNGIRDTVVGTASIIGQGFSAVFPPLPSIPLEYRERIDTRRRIEARELIESEKRIAVGELEAEQERAQQRKLSEKYKSNHYWGQNCNKDFKVDRSDCPANTCTEDQYIGLKYRMSTLSKPLKMKSLTGNLNREISDISVELHKDIITNKIQNKKHSHEDNTNIIDNVPHTNSKQLKLPIKNNKNQDDYNEYKNLYNNNLKSHLGKRNLLCDPKASRNEVLLLGIQQNSIISDKIRKVKIIDAKHETIKSNEQLQSSKLFDKCNKEGLPLENSFNRIFGDQNDNNNYEIEINKKNEIEKLIKEKKNSIIKTNFCNYINENRLKSTEIFTKCNNEYIPLVNSFSKIFGNKDSTTKEYKHPNVISKKNNKNTVVFTSTKTDNELLKFNYIEDPNYNYQESSPLKRSKISTDDTMHDKSFHSEYVLDSDYLYEYSNNSMCKTRDLLMDLYLDEQLASVYKAHSLKKGITIDNNSENNLRINRHRYLCNHDDSKNNFPKKNLSSIILISEDYTYYTEHLGSVNESQSLSTAYNLVSENENNNEINRDYDSNLHDFELETIISEDELMNTTDTYLTKENKDITYDEEPIPKMLMKNGKYNDLKISIDNEITYKSDNEYLLAGKIDTNHVNISSQSKQYSEKYTIQLSDNQINPKVNNKLLNYKKLDNEHIFQKIIPYDEFMKISTKLPVEKHPTLSKLSRTNTSSKINILEQDLQKRIHYPKIDIVKLSKDKLSQSKSPKPSFKKNFCTSVLFKSISSKQKYAYSPSKENMLSHMAPFKPYASPLISPMTLATKLKENKKRETRDGEMSKSVETVQKPEVKKIYSGVGKSIPPNTFSVGKKVLPILKSASHKINTTLNAISARNNTINEHIMPFIENTYKDQLKTSNNVVLQEPDILDLTTRGSGT